MAAAAAYEYELLVPDARGGPALRLPLTVDGRTTEPVRGVGDRNLSVQLYSSSTVLTQLLGCPRDENGTVRAPLAAM